MLAVQSGMTIHICQRGLLQRRCCGALAAVQLSAHEVAIESMQGSNTLQVASGLQIRGQHTLVPASKPDVMSLEKKRERKTTPFGVTFMRSQVLLAVIGCTQRDHLSVVWVVLNCLEFMHAAWAIDCPPRLGIKPGWAGTRL